jgi:hypothetical protein
LYKYNLSPEMQVLLFSTTSRDVVDAHVAGTPVQLESLLEAEEGRGTVTNLNNQLMWTTKGIRHDANIVANGVMGQSGAGKGVMRWCAMN